MEINKININKEDKKDSFLNIKLFKDYLISNDIRKEQNNYIYIKYLENNDIIFQDKGDINNVNLKLLLEELNKDIDNKNNILFPFLNIFPNLISAYINSDLDNIIIDNKELNPDLTQSKYFNTFIKLKNNCFINREALYPIYNNFSNLYDIVTGSREIEKEDDYLFKRLNKLIKLFEVLYEKNINNENISSFCFLGASMEIIFNQALKLSEIHQLNITVNFTNDYFNYLDNNLNLIKVNDVEIKITELLALQKNNGKIKCIKFNIKNENFLINLFTKSQFVINILIIFEEKKVTISNNLNINEIKTFTLFEEFCGQISYIEIAIGKDKNKVEYQFLPTAIRNENYIYFLNKRITDHNKTPNLSGIIPKISINNKKLVKINYLNYNDIKFDIINYYGGIIQFLPFYQIFKKLKDFDNADVNDNKNILSLKKCLNLIEEDINNFQSNILKVIIRKLFVINDNLKNFKKYGCFVYYLLLDLNLKINLNLDSLANEYKEKDNLNNVKEYLDILNTFYYNIRNSSLDNIKEEIDKVLKNKNLNIFTLPIKTFNQLYKQYMKDLFSFNGLWSKRNIFFPKRYNNINNRNLKIKYKQINYYTKNFQFPFFYPILEFKKYYPNFSRYKDGDKLFKENERNILEYNFELNTNEKVKKIIDELVSYNKKSDIITSKDEKCCLIKNLHHIFGELYLIRNKNDNLNNNFRIFFKAKKIENIEENKTCNKPNLNPTDKNICYGSIFSCPEREYRRSIVIKSQDILFILIRVYYLRLSAIEIFTINKSYYFNLKKSFEINNIKKIKFLNEISENISTFRELKIKVEKDKLLTIGYYNIKYKSYLFPFFENKVDKWIRKIKYYNNFDTINLINIFSNRSFRDVTQYPIFPTLYNLIGYKREMENHIGLQTLTEESKERKTKIIKNYVNNKSFDCGENEQDEEGYYLLNIHCSNPAFVFNYLLRVLPYSFLAIEFQGDNFDDSNRLFFSIENALKSTLKNKSDLREMIPELYYMIELYYNKNNILFRKIASGKSIDNVIIKNNQNMESEIKIMQNYAQFLYMFRKNLEEEENLNKWIDLIFGINKNCYEPDSDHSYNYYNKFSKIDFKTDTSLLEDKIIMDMVNFGLLPYQLFHKEFVKKDKKSNETLIELNKLNIELFKDEHIKINSPVQTFFCKGRILIDYNYIKIIEPNEKLVNKLDYFNVPETIAENLNIFSKKQSINNYIFNNTFGYIDMDIEKIEDKYIDSMSLVNYYFIGDIYGTVLVYVLRNSTKNDKEKKKKKKETKKKDYKEIHNKSEFGSKFTLFNFEFEVQLIKQLYNHTKEIKYIDFNPRLNILLSYSLDNFINIYIVPKFKLINVIDTYSFRNDNDKNDFDEVVLLSYPFPSIVCHNKEYIYYLSINGELIKYDKLLEGEKIIFSIDKNVGTIEDKVEIYDSENKLKLIFNIFEENK